MSMSRRTSVNYSESKDVVDVTGEPEDVIHQADLYEAFTRFCSF